MTQVKADTSDLRRLYEEQLKTLPDQAKRAFHTTIRETERHARMVVAKAVAGEYAITAADVKNPKNASLSARNTEGGVALVYRGHTLTLRHFKYTPKTRQSKGGRQTRAQVKKPGYKSLGPYAFIGGTGALTPGKVASIPFMRLGRERLPIKPVHGPSIPQMVGNEEKVAPAVMEDLSEYMTNRFEHHMAWYGKGGGK